MKRVAEFVLRHRLVICLTWLGLLVAGGAAAGQLTDKLSFDFSLPGQPGYETEKQIEETYGVSSFDTLIPLLTVPEGQTVEDNQASVADVFETVRTQLPQARVVDFASTGDPLFISEDGRTT